MEDHKTSKGSPNEKKLKFSDLNKTQNKEKLIKVKIKRLKTKQRNSGGLLHKELKQEKLRKMLTQIKLGVVVVPENRATFRKNTVIKRFKLKIRWFTTLPVEDINLGNSQYLELKKI